MRDEAPPSPSELPFAESFERLVALLRGGARAGPGVDAALGAARTAVARQSAFLEAGVETSAGIDDESLKGRLLARQVDTVRVEAGASGEELLDLAQALASDSAPIGSSARVRVELVSIAPTPPSDYGKPPGGRASGPVGTVTQRERTGDGLPDLIGSLSRALTEAQQRGNVREALHAAQALIRLVPAAPEHSRRGLAISIRRYLPRTLLETFVQFALRTPEEQSRAAEVLRWAGLDGAEVMLAVIRGSEAVGPRGFLFDALGQMPEAYPVVVPLLASSRWHEVRHGAELVGRLRIPEGIAALRSQLNHPDERVRAAVIEALARFPDNSVVEALRQALTHASPQTRAVAGRALASRGSGALAMPLLAALEAEKNATAWRELLGAMTRIEAPEATNALVRLATERKSLLGRRGHSLAQRLEVVWTLAQARSPAARHALQRIAAEGDAALQEAARKALESLA